MAAHRNPSVSGPGDTSESDRLRRIVVDHERTVGKAVTFAAGATCPSRSLAFNFEIDDREVIALMRLRAWNAGTPRKTIGASR